MRASQIHKRLETLAATIRPNATREFTFEELCRLMWRKDKRGFLAMANGEFPALRVFVSSFEREDAEDAACGPSRTRAGRAARSGKARG